MEWMVTIEGEAVLVLHRMWSLRWEESQWLRLRQEAKAEQSVRSSME